MQTLGYIADILSIVSFICSLWAIKEVKSIKNDSHDKKAKQWGFGGKVNQSIDQSDIHGKKR